MINFGALNTGGFQNALAQGLQLGQAVGQARRERETNNALAQFDPTKPETLKPVMQADARLGVQLLGQVQEQQAAQRKQRGLDRRTYAQLLQTAGTNPQQAFSAAQQMGLDLSGLPQIGTPEFEQWRQTELFILEALSDPEKLTAVQQDARALGLDLGTPEGRKAVQELTLYKYAKQGIDESGRPTLELPTITIPAPNAAGQVGTTVGRFYGVFDVQGPEGAVAWSQQNPVRVSTPQEASSLPRGTRIILPDGSEGRVP